MSVDVTPNGTVGTKASEPEVRLSRIFSPAVVAAHRAFGEYLVAAGRCCSSRA
jgi:hypothetical protein